MNKFLSCVLVLFSIFSYAQTSRCLKSNYELNGGATDSGYFKIDGIVDGAVSTEDRNGIPGQAMLFDGLNDKIVVGDYFNQNSQEFSISLWVKVNHFYGQKPGTETVGAYIVNKGLTIYGTPKKVGYGVFASLDEGENTISFCIGSEEIFFYAKAKGLQKEVWYHVLAVKKQCSIEISINGNLVQSTIIPAGLDLNSNIPFVIGSNEKLGNDPNGITYFSGAIDDVKIYDCVISTCELEEYISDPCNTENNKIAHFPIESDAADLLSENHGVISGTQTVSDRNFADSAKYFNGVDDEIVVGNHLNLGSNDFSISLWAKIEKFDGFKPGTETYGAYLINKGLTIYGTPKKAGYGLLASKIDNVNQLEFKVSNGGSFYNAVAKDLKTDVWYFIQAVKLSDKIKLYINGQLTDEVNISANLNVNSNIPLVFGSVDKLGNDAKGITYFNGVLDDIIFYNKSLYECKNEETIITSIVLSENKTGNQFIIYPNPNQGVFQVKSNSNEKKIALVQILDFKGEIVYSTNSNTINLEHHNSGAYIVRVKFNDETISNEKIIIK